MDPNVRHRIMLGSLSVQPEQLQVQPLLFTAVTLNTPQLNVAPNVSRVVPVMRPSQTIRLETIKFIDPNLAQAISKIPLAVEGVKRETLSVPISLTEDTTDQLLYEEAADAAKKLYIPRYRLAVTRDIAGNEQYAASVQQTAEGWSLRLRLEKYPAAQLQEAARAAGEFPHQVAVILKYQLAGASGIQKELIFQEVTAIEDGIEVVLRVANLAERDELVRAISTPEHKAALIVRRAISVAVPVPQTEKLPEIVNPVLPLQPDNPVFERRIIRDHRRRGIERETTIEVTENPALGRRVIRDHRRFRGGEREMTVEPNLTRFAVSSRNLEAMRFIRDAANDAQANDVIWVDDALPTGAVARADNETWNWINANPAPLTGTLAHQSNIVAGVHQHYFDSATAKLHVSAGSTLFAHVYLDPANPPREVMLQWNDGTWEHRAYWGENLIGWGVDGTVSRRRTGDLPKTGEWVRLEVPATLVGLEGKDLNGMAFTLYDGRATWDCAGVSANVVSSSTMLFRETTRTLDDVQSPFIFDRDLHRYIFANIGGAGVGASQNPGLIRWEEKWKDIGHGYFQEQARPYIFYYLPDSFKIARRPQIPHAPIMSVQIDAADETAENTKVTLDYVAAPFVDAERLADASVKLRVHLPRELPADVTEPVFFPLLTDSDKVKFSVSLPRGGRFMEPRESALINLRTGLVDSLRELPLAEFQAIFDAMADTTGAAVLFRGEVELDLGQGVNKDEKINFIARLNDAIGELFDYQKFVNEASGEVRATLRNAIESPLRINSLKAKLRRGDAEVAANVLDISTPVELRPDEFVEVRILPLAPLQGTGTVDAVFDLSDVEVLPDLSAIWNIFVAGQKPEYTKPITVKAAASIFAALADNPDNQILEIDVQFKNGTTVTLSPQAVEANASVWFPLGDLVVSKAKSEAMSDEYEFRPTFVRRNDALEGAWTKASADILRIFPNMIPQ